jgi:hypothetical protein
MSSETPVPDVTPAPQSVNTPGPSGPTDVARYTTIGVAVCAGLILMMNLLNFANILYQIIALSIYAYPAKTGPMILYVLIGGLMLLVLCVLGVIGIAIAILYSTKKKETFDLSMSYAIGLFWWMVCMNFINIIFGIFAASVQKNGVIIASVFVGVGISILCCLGCIAFGAVNAYIVYKEVPQEQKNPFLKTLGPIQIGSYITITTICVIITILFLLVLFITTVYYAAIPNAVTPRIYGSADTQCTGTNTRGESLVLNECTAVNGQGSYSITWTAGAGQATVRTFSDSYCANMASTQVQVLNQCLNGGFFNIMYVTQRL